MDMNADFISSEERDKIIYISQKTEKFLYQIGQECGIRDKSFWSKIMNGKKPIPEHARKAINQIFRKEIAKDDK